ncbi:DUF1637 domain-containing protein [Cephalotus follicularis]|uniref:cysteine dioxygenase n=1 Tax=Cephalotus follicularis TaxID=3775 RepID=A0A1Q3BQM0_CEPFO|nr:DUF1637 domain-containing protein [Cephalotus follicularis]
MGIETTVADKKGTELCELSTRKVTDSNSDTIKTNRRPKKQRRRNKKMQLPVQKLYETCKDVFAIGGAGIVPSTDNIEKLRAVLVIVLDAYKPGFYCVDDIQPDDVGLSPEMPYFRTQSTRRTPAITYLHLFDCDNFSIGIFCLPPSGVIPLHNHPGMTVFSKLLFGTMHIKSYDWVDPVADVPCSTSALNPSQSNAVQHPGVRLAKLKVNADFTAPCNASILYPADGGNMHCFTALTPCAVLDVLGPPYSDPEGRHCQYYLDFPFSDFIVDGIKLPEDQREGHAWLQEREKPEDLAVVGSLYRGPKIVEK